MVSGYLAHVLNAVNSWLVLSFSINTSNRQTAANKWCATSETTSLPLQTRSILLNSTTQNVYVKLMVLMSRHTWQSISLTEYVETQHIHLSRDLKRKKLSSPWEGLIYAAVLSSSAPPAAKGAKKIPCNWRKKSGQLSAKADLAELAPIPHWSSSVQGASKPTAQPRKHNQNQQSFLLDPENQAQISLWAVLKVLSGSHIPFSLLHLEKVVYWTLSSCFLLSLYKHKELVFLHVPNF